MTFVFLPIVLFLLFSRFFSLPPIMKPFTGLNHHLLHQMHHSNGGQTHDSTTMNGTTNGALTNYNNHPIHHDNIISDNDHHHQNNNNNQHHFNHSNQQETSSSSSSLSRRGQVTNGMNAGRKNGINDGYGDGEIELMNREELELKEREQLMEINLLRKKLQETENAMANIIASMGQVPIKGQVRFWIVFFCLEFNALLHAGLGLVFLEGTSWCVADVRIKSMRFKF